MLEFFVSRLLIISLHSVFKSCVYTVFRNCQRLNDINDIWFIYGILLTLDRSFGQDAHCMCQILKRFIHFKSSLLLFRNVPWLTGLTCRVLLELFGSTVASSLLLSPSSCCLDVLKMQLQILVFIFKRVSHWILTAFLTDMRHSGSPGRFCA